MPVDSMLLPVARAFAHFLNLANIAEQHHRVRRRRAPSPRSEVAAAARLLRGGVRAADCRRHSRRDRLHDAVCSLRIELVLTAHPTEVSRRTLVEKYNRIAALLDAARSARSERATSTTEIVAALRAGDLDGVGHQRCPARAADAARRGARRPDRVRAEPVARRAPLPAQVDRALQASTGDGAAARRRCRSASARGSAATATATRTSHRRSRGGPACWRGGWPPTSTSARVEALRDELSMTDATPELRAVDRRRARAVPRAAARGAQAHGRHAAGWIESIARAGGRRPARTCISMPRTSTQALRLCSRVAARDPARG